MASPPTTPPPDGERRIAEAPLGLSSADIPLDVKQVPTLRTDRERIRECCAKAAAELDRSRPLSQDEMERVAQQILENHDLPLGYRGWTMVALASEFWRDQITAVPIQQRLLLLPHCLRDVSTCPADFNEIELACQNCGACCIGELRQTALELGYHVLVAEGSPIVTRMILDGSASAILGVACLNTLEQAVDKVLMASIPCAAVPLLSSTCQDSTVDEDWVREMILLPHAPTSEPTRSYVHLMRKASNLFESEQLELLAPRIRSHARPPRNKTTALETIDPIAGTEALAYDFLGKGGKHSRPFITLAVHDALTGEHATGGDGADSLDRLPKSVLRTAMSIETFHKASLVHDDIEDNDSFRYGEPTLHRKYGVPTAINVGDYLIGMGYRLLSDGSKSTDSQITADIIRCLADAHTKLCEGQGAELFWRNAHTRQIEPIDALKIYALKTAPAFEAAILSGIRLTRRLEEYTVPVRQFARNLGVAFQILNDLKDWQTDADNKLSAGSDILGGRPTVLWALACEALKNDDLTQLIHFTQTSNLPNEYRVNHVRQLYHRAGAFENANRLVQKHRSRAQAIADQMTPTSLRHLFHFLIDSVLAGS